MDYTYDKGFCRHMIGNEGDQESAICIKLAQQTILNNIRLLLWDKDDRNVQNTITKHLKVILATLPFLHPISRAYSYYIEVSVDGKDFIKIIDYSNYHCRSWQNLYFPQRVVRFIRVVGTHNTVR